MPGPLSRTLRATEELSDPSQRAPGQSGEKDGAEQGCSREADVVTQHRGPGMCHC